MYRDSTSAKRLFAAGDVNAVELDEADLPELQIFFSNNPEYFITVHGEPPRPDEAQLEFFDRPPPEMPCEHVLVVGFVDSQDCVIAMVSIIKNLLAENVWHISLFVVATHLHGSGVAHALYSNLEQWLREQDAVWIRLGVVSGHVKAERFWTRQGYVEIRRRHNVQLGKLTHTVGVFVKPLGQRGLTEYLGLVPRDQPESSLS
jgi:GNAT superfamily N-acetyltransferase